MQEQNKPKTARQIAVEQVNEFMRKCREEDPDKYYSVLKEFPVVSWKRWKKINDMEIPFCDLDEEI